jgi:spermidine synthase
MRELRLIFGSSTMATSAVLAIFMGGIGLGSIFLGRKVEQHRNPLFLYGYFELIIAISAMLTPFLIFFVGNLYLRTGGSQSLGFLPATLFSLFLSTLILGVPTFFMGGTLPAIAKTVLREIDLGRRDFGYLYGINTLGAVTGVWLVIFVMLESFGSQNTLLAAGILNIFVAVMALILARHYISPDVSGSELPLDTENKLSAVTETDSIPTIPSSYVYIATCLAGFCFFFMELVWYRMLTPLLGGTTYTIGIILAVALLGLAIGSWGYGLRRYGLATSLRILALICGLEALFMAVPFALGDRLAVLAALLRPIGVVGMEGYLFGWLVISIIVVLPASIAAGYQFPVLINLKGKGSQKIARETGQIYAWNTLGNITGSLIGGMILLPLLGAVPSWQLNVLLLCILAGATLILSIKYESQRVLLIIPGCITVVALLLLLPQGPTAAWRHTPIGAGRTDLSHLKYNEIQDWINRSRRHIIWEKDGREFSLAMEISRSLEFVVNGKVDGNTKWDVGTQVMAPLISAILHPNPQKALVIGLGTGSSTGWLADINSITRVDTIEIEPAMLEVAKRSAPVNRAVLKNKKANIIIGDARELLMSNKEKYDLIFSEPSNPYRVGIASLYTKEFYQMVSKSLNPNGYFSQWVQGYEIDSNTVKIIYSTLAYVFPVVETWETKRGDLLFICSMTESDYSVPRLRHRISKEPFRSALLYSQGTIDIEGLLAHFVANSSFARRVAAEEKEIANINTDDRMLVEYAFAKSLGQKDLFSITDIRHQSKKLGEDRPDLTNGEVDWNLVAINKHTKAPWGGWLTPDIDSIHDDAQKSHLKAFNFYIQGNTQGVLEEWNKYGTPPVYPFEIMVLAESLAQEGHPSAKKYIEMLQNYWPSTAKAILARFYWQTGARDLAHKTLEKVIMEFRTNPWPQTSVMRHTLSLMKTMASTDKELAKKLYALLSEPFSVYNFEFLRLITLYAIAKDIDPQYIADAIENFEPHPPWNENFLVDRLQSYKQTGNSLAKQAEKDFNRYKNNEPLRFIVNDSPLK